ncbi:hypothetical protein RYX36_036506, partial [Vicia faba]
MNSPFSLCFLLSYFFVHKTTNISTNYQPLSTRDCFYRELGTILNSLSVIIDDPKISAVGIP